MREWLEFCDQVHKANGLSSLRRLASAMGLTSATRVGEMLRGLALPADDKQARTLLAALGATDPEVERGFHRYKAARARTDQAAREAARPGWWQRCGYLGQVADIAPMDRQDELDELAGWCAGGDEAYAWWQAGPRSGKSALMAWLVLHPPPGAQVVSFFVTARLASQADSAAFTDALLDQLTAITGDQVPPLTSAEARDRLRRQLLAEAAARAAKSGRRLVLVVDGLDEDCGSMPGSGLSSIAACLPERPPPGLQVIVAGRPDPPVPADVDVDHPLRGCRIRRLDASPHAARVTELAQRELDEVLATDKDRHDGLGYQVIGLVTACGGGLDHRDLQELTGRPAFEIDWLLRGVFGRTVAGRADPQTTKRVFLFTHETLREQAIDRLGPGTLAGFAARLHAWADGYQRRGWPADTPAYLLRAYQRMLADAGDLGRLVALATDYGRHDRMLDSIGGDAAALAEITAACTLLSTQPSPDLLAALRLASHRDQLFDRNARLPAHLPAAWAAIGQPIRSEALARSITDPYRQAEALARLAAAAADSGDLGRARALAAEVEEAVRSTNEPYMLAYAKAALAAAVASVGDLDRAEQLARSISGKQEGKALAGVAVAAAGWDIDRAEQLARAISGECQAEALAGVAAAAAGLGDLSRAQALASSAEQAVRSTIQPHHKAKALGVLVTVVAGWDIDRAEQLAHPLWEQAFSSLRDPNHMGEALAALVTGLASIAYVRDSNIAGALAAEVVRIALPFTKTLVEQAETLAHMAAAVAGIGDLDRAQALAASAEQIARSTADNGLEQAQAALAAAVADTGDLDRAEQIARSITNPDEQAKALASVIDARNPARARTKDEVLAALPASEADTGDLDRAERAARSITNPDERAKALAALASAAEPVRARLFIVSALTAGRWTIPLQAIARIDPVALSTFANEWISLRGTISVTG